MIYLSQVQNLKSHAENNVNCVQQLVPIYNETSVYGYSDCLAIMLKLFFV